MMKNRRSPCQAFLFFLATGLTGLGAMTPARADTMQDVIAADTSGTRLMIGGIGASNQYFDSTLLSASRHPGFMTSSGNATDGTVSTPKYGFGNTPYTLSLGTPSDDGTSPDHWLWFGLNGADSPNRALRAQIGLGYAPTPDTGLAVGPFVDLNGSIGNQIGIYPSGTMAGTDLTGRRMGRQNRESASDDAGLAASLSYMPLPDIWIGLHGSVSRSLTPDDGPNNGALDGIDAMLGLTAHYRFEF
ncbi:hypothetical protein LPB41_23170 [Thalassospira sp. MA62]|nr:hypothetical protein [Thalassospira sp. MA62]